MPTERMTAEEFRKSGLQVRGSQRPVTDYKADLLRQMRDAGLPEPVAEFRFHADRKWRFDYAIEDLKIGIEYDGGIFDKLPSHSSVGGILRDIEKLNEAQLDGWIVVRVTPASVANGTALRYIKRAVQRRKSVILDGENQKVADVRRTLKGLIERLGKE